MNRPSPARWLVIAPIAFAVVLISCGGTAKPVASEAPAPQDARAPARPAISQRRDAACDALGPRLTACAVEDARADLAAGKIQKPQFDRDTAPEVQSKNTAEFLKACKASSYSSRQVRVLEVCFREETRCAPLIDCLGHLNDPR
jgi:hypothetical protein